MYEDFTESTGNWQSDFVHELQERGYRNVLELLKRNPGKTFLSLANDLGVSVPAIHLVGLAFREARLCGELRWASMDSLVREIRDVFPNGWGKVHEPPYSTLLSNEERSRMLSRPEKDKISYQEARTFAAWVSDVAHVPANVERHLHAVWNALRQIARDSWLPDGPDDQTIVAAFDKGWPATSIVEYLPIGPHTLCPKCSAHLALPEDEDLVQMCQACGVSFPLFGFD